MSPGCHSSVENVDRKRLTFADDGKETNRQAASGPRLPGPKHSLAVSQEDMPTEVEELADTELTSLYLASALTCTDISETEVTTNASVQ